jgi:hypothetical protein
MLEENLLRITYTNSSALGGTTTITAEVEYEHAVARGTRRDIQTGWGQAKLLQGRVRVERSRWQLDDEERFPGAEHVLDAEALNRVATALKALRFGIAPFDNPVLYVTDGWSGDLKIEAGDVTVHAHWFLDPPPHFHGLVDLIDALTP